MLTKGQLIKTLEPFDDDIEIVILSEKNYKHEPRIFYSFNETDDAAQILLVTRFMPMGKAVELKVK